MSRMLRAVVLMLPLLGAGCAEVSQVFCRSEGERAGVLLGQQYAGTNCYSSGGYTRHGRSYSSVSGCTPNVQNVYQWTPNSDRVYEACMARTAAQYGTPQAAVAPAANVPLNERKR